MRASGFKLSNMLVFFTRNLALIASRRKSVYAAAAATTAVQQTSLPRRSGSYGPVRKVGKDR